MEPSYDPAMAKLTRCCSTFGLFLAAAACSDNVGPADRGPAGGDARPADVSEVGDLGGADASGRDTGRDASAAADASPTADASPATDASPTDADAGISGCTEAWRSGFENGFPGEWLNYDNGSWSENGTMPNGRVSAWTIVDQASGEPIFAGQHAYKGWIAGAAAESHRAYPGIHTNLPTPLVNTFWVYLDADYSALSPSDWIHFGTWGNWDPESDAGVWALHTMSMRDRKLEFAHTNPFLGEYVGPQPQPDFPLRQWVRFTVYVHYAGATGTVHAWQDGVPVLRAEVSQLAANPGTNLRTAHWGMYAAPTVTAGVQYNDDVLIWTLAAPLTDFSVEPRCF